MALDQADLAALGSFISNEVGKATEALRQEFATRAATPENRAAQVGVPDVDPDAGPDYWVHLADGTVTVSKDSTSTHMPGPDGETIPVIGRYLKG